jgi:hypothetical protein
VAGVQAEEWDPCPPCIRHPKVPKFRMHLAKDLTSKSRPLWSALPSRAPSAAATARRVARWDLHGRGRKLYVHRRCLLLPRQKTGKVTGTIDHRTPRPQLLARACTPLCRVHRGMSPRKTRGYALRSWRASRPHPQHRRYPMLEVETKRTMSDIRYHRHHRANQRNRFLRRFRVSPTRRHQWPALRSRRRQARQA